MTITFHVSLADPAGDNHPGPEFDCPRCRAALLEAFRSPADAQVPRPAYDPVEQAKQRHPSGRDLHVAEPEHGLYPEPENRRTDPFTEEQQSPEVHTTEHGIEDDPDVVGGEWFARCSCGWSDGGTYAHQAHAAGRLAKLRADAHRRDPQEPVAEEEHVTQSSVISIRDAEGGTWKAWCSCGWETGGHVARTTGIPAATRLARLKADQHRKDENQ